MTNFEKIKQMSVEELALFLSRTTSQLAVKLISEYVIRTEAHIKLWLESEV